MAFWIVTGILGLAVTGLMVLALWRPGGRDQPDQVSDVQVYRDQLEEVDRDLARGVLTPDDAARVRVEVSRRLLEADRAAQAGQGAGAAPRALTYAGAAVVVAALVGSFGLYNILGDPQYPDLPLSVRLDAAAEARATRPGQAEVEESAAARRPPPPETDPRFDELMAMLRKALDDNPDDPRGLQLLAANEARLGNFTAAYAAQERLIEVKGDGATAMDYADLADLMILAAGGIVSPEADAVLTAALDRDPSNGPARYYSGLSLAQTGRPDLALRIWDRLWRDSPADAPWLVPMREQMPALAQLAGVRWTPPESRGPSAEDMANAEDMTPQERLEMIQGMVEGLAARLGTEGGPPEDWARLISSLVVLGNTEDAAAIWTEAQAVFAEVPAALEIVRAAAVRAGVAE